jgi:hypothetical protein
VLAERFVEAAVNKQTDVVLSVLKRTHGLSESWTEGFVIERAAATLAPRDWSDIWRCRRRIGLYVVGRTAGGSSAFGFNAHVEAGIFGVEASSMLEMGLVSESKYPPAKPEAL